MCIHLIKSLWKQRVVWRSGLPEHRVIPSGARRTLARGHGQAGPGAAEQVAWAFAHNGVFLAIACLMLYVRDSIPR